MAKLIYGMIQSLDGYTEDANGKFGWGAPDEGVHPYVNEVASSVSTYLYGRRMYETMVFWETVHELPEGKRFFPDDVRLNLELIEERQFGNGVVALRYTARA